jgi:YVTN family beta-propeller protein
MAGAAHIGRLASLTRLMMSLIFFLKSAQAVIGLGQRQHLCGSESKTNRAGVTEKKRIWTLVKEMPFNVLFPPMKLRLASLVLLAGISGANVLYAQDTPRDSLLVLSKAEQTLAIVDPSSLQAIARIPVGNDPHEVIASTDGKTAYASNYGGGAYNTLAVVDLVARKALPPIDLGPLRGPHGLAFVGGKAWFTAEAAKAIGSYDPATQKIDWILGTGQNRTHMIYVWPDLKRIVTTNVSSGTVSIIEKTVGGGAPGGNWDETVVRVGQGSEGFDVSPGGKEIWVANAGDGTVSIIDVSSKTVTQTLAVDVGGANRLKFTPNGKLALISSLRGPDVTIIDSATRKTIKRIPVGHGAAGILMQPDGSRAFVACTPDNYVAVIDLHSLEVVGHIDAGKNPDGLAWATRR